MVLFAVAALKVNFRQHSKSPLALRALHQCQRKCLLTKEKIIKIAGPQADMKYFDYF